MIGIILASHGKLAEGILDSGKMIYNKVENVETVILKNMDGIESFKNNLYKAIDGLKDCNDILMMCDLQGGSPFNISLQLSIENDFNKNIKTISGLNLPMFLETLADRDNCSLQELVDIAYNSGRDGIVVPNIDSI